MTLTVHKRTTWNLSLDKEDDEREFPLTHAPSEYHDKLVEELPDGRVLVGYLSHDENCSHPLEGCDGCGKILRRYRDAPQEEKRRFYEEWGVNEYGERIGPKNPLAVSLDVYIHSGEAWRVHGSGRYFPDERWDVSNQAGIWIPDECCLLSIHWLAAQEVLTPHPETAARRVAAGEAAREPVQCDYELQFTQHYRGPERPARQAPYSYGWRWRDRQRGGYSSLLNAACGAAWAFGKKFDLKAFQRECWQEALVCANQAVETYNDWLSGDCWGVCVEAFDKDGESLAGEAGYDACWGYIGASYAEQTLRDEFARQKAYLLKTPAA